MKISKLLNKNFFSIFILFLSFYVGNLKAEEEPIDIWKLETSNEQNSLETVIEENDSVDNSIIQINENVTQDIEIINYNKIEEENTIVGLYDPDENGLKIDMWLPSDGNQIKEILNRLNKIKLSNDANEILEIALLTNSYSPNANISEGDFINFKVEYLIKNNDKELIKSYLLKNSNKTYHAKLIKYYANENLAESDLESACEIFDNINIINDDYLYKFKIYCLINNERKEEAQLVFDLYQEKDSKDKFFEDKINFLLGITDQTTQKILDDDLLNFYFSYITSNNFEYEPNDKTDKYIWKYLSSANLIQVNNFEDENVIFTYEQAAAQNSFDNDEIFTIYLKMNFNFNQLMNAEEIYKNLPNYKARALIYQSMLLTDGIEKKINLAFLLKDLFIKDKILSVYVEELSSVLKSIDPDLIPEAYAELVEQNLDSELTKKIKFDNDILHRSKVIKHFLDENQKLSKTENDFKSVYKKIKKNKKYFISIRDIVVLESLAADGISLPEDLDYTALSSQLTVPKNLEDLASQNQIGLVMLKIVEIIGEDNISDLDPETVYFLNKILNELNLKKIRNNILSEALPVRV